jgi:hypothetical protein
MFLLCNSSTLLCKSILFARMLFGGVFCFVSDLARLFARLLFSFGDCFFGFLPNASNCCGFGSQLFAHFAALLSLLLLLLLQKLFLLILEVFDDVLQFADISATAVAGTVMLVGPWRAIRMRGPGLGSHRSGVRVLGLRAHTRKAKNERDSHNQRELVFNGFQIFLSETPADDRREVCYTLPVCVRRRFRFGSRCRIIGSQSRSVQRQSFKFPSKL